MTRVVVGLGCTALALILLIYSIYTSVGENVQGKYLPLGLALVLILAGVTMLHSSRSRV